MTLRVLGAVRLSRLTDQSTSPERQRERVEWWASGNDGRVVDVAVDLDVSGSVSPFERDDLGPWLTRRAGEWDVLVAWKLDRLSRSARDTLDLLGWAQENGKRIVAVDDNLDTATQMGRVWIQLASIFAEVERTNIQERVSAARKYLRQAGRWGGSKAPYGHRVVGRPEGGKQLALNEAEEPVVVEIVGRVLARESLVDIARDLNDRRVPAPSGKVGSGWTHGQLRRMLRRPSLRGLAEHDGRLVRDSEGVPVVYGPPLVDGETWTLLQRELDTRQETRAPYRAVGSAGFLLDVAFCVCGRKMYATPAKNKKYDASMYRCAGYRAGYGPRCTVSAGMRSARLEEFVEEKFLAAVGRLPIRVRTDTPAVDRSGELADIEMSLRELREDRAAGLFRGPRGTSEFRAAYSKLEDRREELLALASQETATEWSDTGLTFAAEWAVASNQRKRELLLDCGARVEVGPAKSRGAKNWRDRLRFDLRGPEWLLELGTDDPLIWD
ncbi:recombinase family protein [Saccharopolyspora erythraea]|uniref:recombinase family protein n=1 Tax=Saccharopolyspora erythraea TaxID=1836 RepID=UPI001BA59F5C|nr:recombinase family protein [Saccharopolyspora erythraea]QUH01465.1 recombinase family protein [Saccharopolyspora erythraea]